MESSVRGEKVTGERVAGVPFRRWTNRRFHASLGFQQPLGPKPLDQNIFQWPDAIGLPMERYGLGHCLRARCPVEKGKVLVDERVVGVKLYLIVGTCYVRL